LKIRHGAILENIVTNMYAIGCDCEMKNP